MRFLMKWLSRFPQSFNAYHWPVDVTTAAPRRQRVTLRRPEHGFGELIGPAGNAIQEG